MKPLFRMSAIMVVTLILVLPLSMILSVVQERTTRLREVEKSTAASLAGEQRLVGPLLVVPYSERTVVDETDDKGRPRRRVVERPGKAVFVADTLQFNVSADIEPRQRGLFKVNVVQTKGKLVARFSVPRLLGLDVDPRQLTVGEARLAWGVSDVRGLRGAPQVTWNGETMASEPGPGVARIGDGFHTPLPRFSVQDDAIHEVRAALEIVGTQALSWVPVAKSSTVALQSAWPHPSFGGSFLPVSREISANGFTARWEVPYLASRNVDLVTRQDSGNESERRLEGFEVRFIDPVNHYTLADRAIKHGMLFIVVSIAGFFLLDVLKKLFVHPIQYAFVGLALALFFLLLLALSEHLPFVWAYVASAGACIALIGAYVRHVLRGWGRTLIFAGQLVLLYAALYALLQSEDHALLLGALLTFATLAVAMLATRKIDWHGDWQGAAGRPVSNPAADGSV